MLLVCELAGFLYITRAITHRRSVCNNFLRQRRVLVPAPFPVPAFAPVLVPVATPVRWSTLPAHARPLARCTRSLSHRNCLLTGRYLEPRRTRRYREEKSGTGAYVSLRDLYISEDTYVGVRHILRRMVLTPE